MLCKPLNNGPSLTPICILQSLPLISLFELAKRKPKFIIVRQSFEIEICLCLYSFLLVAMKPIVACNFYFTSYLKYVGKKYIFLKNTFLTKWIV